MLATISTRPIENVVPSEYFEADASRDRNSETIGAGSPLVVVNSELVQLLDAEQMRGVFAHEAGHVLSEHVLYRTALVIVLRLTTLPGIPLPRKWIMRDTRRGVLQVLESFRGVLERNEQLQSKPDDVDDTTFE